MIQENYTRTTEQQEQLQILHSTESVLQRKEYMMVIFLEEGSLYISYHGKYFLCKDYIMGLKVNQEILFMGNSKDLMEFDDFHFILLNRYFAFLKVRKKGEENARYYSTIGFFNKLSLFSIRVLYGEEESFIFSLLKFLENYAEMFYSQTEGYSLSEMSQTSRMATIILEGIMAEKRQR